MDIAEIIKKRRACEPLSQIEISFLLNLPSDSPQVYLMMAEADHIARNVSSCKAEVHAYVSFNPGDFERTSLHKTVSFVIQQIQTAEYDGANAIIVRSDGNCQFGTYLDIAYEIKSRINPETLLIADIGGLSLKNAIRLKESGFTGVYYSLRPEWDDFTGGQTESVTRSLDNFLASGLEVGTCIENIGPEHTGTQIAAMINYLSTLKISFCGAARKRLVQPDNTISDFRLAHLIAVIRLAMPLAVAGNCTKEAQSLVAISGANLFHAGIRKAETPSSQDSGPNKTVADCRSILGISNWDILTGPSRFFN